MFRTVFGDLPVDSPRFTHCACQAYTTESFSPLAELLPERTTPELLYLETKWASLSSYGTSVKLLQDVLPFDEPLEPVTIRNHVCTLAERLEDELGDEQVSFIEGCPRDWGDCVGSRLLSRQWAGLSRENVPSVGPSAQASRRRQGVITVQKPLSCHRNKVVCMPHGGKGDGDRS